MANSSYSVAANSSWPHTTAWPQSLMSTLPGSVSPDDTGGSNHNDSLTAGSVEAPTLAQLLNEVTAFHAAMLLVTWLFPLVVGVGVGGNLVSLWILLRRGMRRTSACRYLACLAVADIVVLLVSALKTWVRVVWDFELLHVSNVTCKLFIFLTHLSLMAAAWLIVAVTLERFLAVWLPLRAIAVCSMGRTHAVIVSLLLLLALINSHVFWTAELLPVSPQHSLSSSGMQCSSYAYKTLVCQVFPWIHLVLYCFLPAFLLLSLNSLILYKLFQHRQLITTSRDSRSSHSSSTRNATNGYYQNPNQLPRNRSQTKLLLKQHISTRSSQATSNNLQQFHRRLAPMLLGVSFCWLLLTTPQTIFNLAMPSPVNMEQVGTQFLVKTICFLLMYTNHAVHFFLYCLTGQRFRQELKQGLVCSNNRRDSRLKNAALPKWHGHEPVHHSQPGEGENEGAEDSMNQQGEAYVNDVQGQHSQYPLVERKTRKGDSPPLHD